MFDSWLPILGEVALATALIFVTGSVCVRPLEHTLVRIASIVARLLVLIVFAILVAYVASWFVDGILPQLLCVIAASAFAAVASLWFKQERWNQWFMARTVKLVDWFPAWARAFIKCMTAVVLIALTFTAIDLAATLSRGSRMADSIRANTILLRYMVGPTTESTERLASDQRKLVTEETLDAAGKTNSRAAKISTAASQQSDFFAQLSAGVRESKRKLYFAVGVDKVKHEIELVQKIHSLDLEDKLWLIKNNPHLAALANNALFQRIVENEPLMDRIDRFTNGELKQLAFISMDPDINALLEDDEFRQTIANIDLKDLLLQARNRPRELPRLISR